MIVIYHGHAGAVSAAVAAAIHSGLLPEDRVPPAREILAVPEVWAVASGTPGRLVWLGRDGGDGHDIHFLAHRARFDVLERVVREVGARLGVDTSDILYVDTVPSVGWAARSLGAAVGFLGIGRLALPALVALTRTAYPRLADLVRQTRARLGQAGDRP